MRPTRGLAASVVFIAIVTTTGCRQTHERLIPRITEPWWTLAGNPDLGPLNGETQAGAKHPQQPVDFGIWQAVDGSWQLWSCIRNTKCGGNTRLLYGWTAARLTDRPWQPAGIRMQADPAVGETPGGLQAPFVVPIEGTYNLFYGDWTGICLARSDDGVRFDRVIGADGRSEVFSGPAEMNTRDPMVLRINRLWHCYYTAHPGRVGAVYCRTSVDLARWSEPRMVARGGEAGSGPYAAECPFVVARGGQYYLFRTQSYQPPITRVYRSSDPQDFGVDDDSCLVARLEVAAPEIVRHDGVDYIAALLPDAQGIRMARLEWTAEPRPADPTTVGRASAP